MLFFCRSNIVIMNDYSENNLSETLRQGIKFKKGQTKIINKTEKKMEKLQESESWSEPKPKAPVSDGTPETTVEGVCRRS